MRPPTHLLAALLVLAGCTGTPVTDTTSPDTTTSTGTPTPPVSLDTAKDRALAAEAARVDKRIAAAENVTGGTPGGTMTPEARVLHVSDGAVRVFVRMSYGYEYRCPEHGAGAVDLATRTVYRVTENKTELVDVREGVRLLCN